ncbi:MAG: c-type cytochrome [Acidobacteriota bacterium]
MKVPVSLNIAGLTIAATIFYTYVGQLVPQKEVLPPQELELSQDLSTEEMVATGRQIMGDKGMCLTCHTIGRSGALRYPDLQGIGSRAATRVPGMSDLEYLAQSLYEPEAYIVEGFAGGMPVINRPPIELTDQEILTVIAYLQTLGGTPTVTMQTRLSYMEGGDVAPVPPVGEAGAAAIDRTVAHEPDVATLGTEQPATPSPTDPVALMNRFQCTSCHHLDQPGQLKGPSLIDVGSRMSYSQILEAILSPEGGHEPSAFYTTATIEQANRMAQFLATRRSAQ